MKHPSHIESCNIYVTTKPEAVLLETFPRNLTLFSSDFDLP